MHFTQKIYCNDKPLVLTDSAEDYRSRFPEAKHYRLLEGATSDHLRMAGAYLSDASGQGILIQDYSASSVKEVLESEYELIEAAGGVVSAPNGNILMIFRRGMWDLPKGKWDEGETIEECALREVEEETGLAELILGDKIDDTFHIYAYKGKNVLKKTHWYHMQTSADNRLQPQLEEDIEEARWIAPNEVALYLNQSYANIKDVLMASGKAAGDQL